MLNFIFIYFIIGLICAIYSFGSLWPAIQGDFPTLKDEYYKKDFRACLLISLLVFLIPPIVIIVAFLCNWNERGYKLW